MKKGLLLILSIGIFAAFSGCKKDTPNVPPLISVTYPDFQESYYVHQHIPIKYSVYDADGLSKLSWSLAHVDIQGIHPISADSLSSVPSNPYVVDTFTTIDNLYGSRDSLVCYYTIKATDATGLTQKIIVRFSVK